MFSNLSLPLAGILGLSSATMGFAIAIAGLLFGGTIAVVAMILHHRRQRLWHETARIALEKGQPIPALREDELAPQPPPGMSYAEWLRLRREHERGHGLRGGLVLIAVGVGMLLMLGPGNYVGAIPGLIGVALIVSALLERFMSRREPGPASEDRAPRP